MSRCTPSPVHVPNTYDTPKSSPLSQPHIPGSLSSDTEDDSQGMDMHNNFFRNTLVKFLTAIYVPGTDTRTGKPTVFLVPAPPPTAGPSNHGNLTAAADTHGNRPRPNFSQASASKELTNSIISPESTDSKALPLPTFAYNESRSSASGRRFEEKDNLEEQTGGETRLKTFSSTSVKGKERELDVDATTPLTTRTMGQTRLEDYSAFKGRGRYGKAVEAQDMYVLVRCLLH